MRYLKTRIRNLGPFTDLSVDLEHHTGPLVAVCGGNGRGKSTFLELLPGALWRTCPTRGSLVSLATSRDSSVELTFGYGDRRYRIRQLIDAVSRKSEAVITDEAGTPLVDSTKVKAVDAFMAEHFIDPRVLMISAFIAQKSGGFVDAKPAERKTLILKAFNVDRAEALAIEARGRAQEKSRAFAVADARTKDEIARGGDLEAAQAMMAAATDHLERAKVEDGIQRRALDFAEDAERKARARDGERLVAAKELTAAGAAMSQATTRVADLRNRIKNNEGILEQADVINAAIDELESVTAELAGAEREQTRQESDLNAGERIARERLERRLEVDARRSSKRDLIANKDAIERASGEVDKLTALIEEAEAELRATDDAIDDAAKAAAGGRIEGLRSGLQSVIECEENPDGPEYVEIATMTLRLDDEAASAPSRLNELKAKSLGLRSHWNALSNERRSAERLAALAPSLANAQREEDECVAVLDAMAVADGQWRDAGAELYNSIRQLTKKIGELSERKVKAARKAALATKLSAAEARLAELTPQLDAAIKAETAAIAAHAAIVVPEALPRINVAVTRNAAEQATASLSIAERAASRAEFSLQLAEGSAETVAVLRAEQAAIAEDLADWQRLAKDLGKDGLQAAIVDAALPELVAMTNSLLHAAFGPRFTVDVRSQTLDSTGKRTLETLDVIVFDGESGREAPVETYSGGEGTIIAEGLSLALTALAARENGLVRPTLVRDEAGAALDPINGRAWIAMLRQAVIMMGADKLLFVSHSSALAEMADSRIEI